MNSDEYRRAVLNELCVVLGGVDSESYNALAELILDSERVFLAGAGRSGLVAKAFAMRLIQMRIESFVVGDATTPAIGKGDLLVIGSGSGETSSMVVAARKAKKYGAEVALVTAYPESIIGRLADLVIRVSAPTPKVEAREPLQHSVQPLGTLFEQSFLLFLDIVVKVLMDRTETTHNDMFGHHANLE
jgi:6-phospho-3-hexuloisomerase